MKKRVSLLIGKERPDLQRPQMELEALTLLLAPRPQGSYALLIGPQAVHDLALYLAGCLLIKGLRAIYIDAANAFDPYLLSRLAQRAGKSPRGPLSRVFVSRAFTCHQLETLILEDLGEELSRRPVDFLLVSGLPTLFFDEAVPFGEAKRIFLEIISRLRGLAHQGLPLLVTHDDSYPGPRRRPLLVPLIKAAEVVARIEKGEGGLEVSLEKPVDLERKRITVPEEGLSDIIRWR
ncbi:MAG: hypothetical protein HY998_08850 [candidate division NC10 bacterium]|nr:hypothetical protein [candidate division NC10 bacterium]